MVNFSQLLCWAQARGSRRRNRALGPSAIEPCDPPLGLLLRPASRSSKACDWRTFVWPARGRISASAPRSPRAAVVAESRWYSASANTQSSDGTAGPQAGQARVDSVSNEKGQAGQPLYRPAPRDDTGSVWLECAGSAQPAVESWPFRWRLSFPHLEQVPGGLPCGIFVARRRELGFHNDLGGVLLRDSGGIMSSGFLIAAWLLLGLGSAVSLLGIAGLVQDDARQQSGTLIPRRAISCAPSHRVNYQAAPCRRPHG